MLFRINRKNFIVHMIDHFTREEILGMKFLLVSVGVKSSRKADNVAKCLELYPSEETGKEFIQYQNMDLFRKNYFQDLDDSEHVIYREILEKVIKECENIVIVCTHTEDEMIDVLVEYLDKKYGLQCVDLNKLFEKGEIPPVKWNRVKIRNKLVDINRRVAKQQYDEDEKTSHGRMKILRKMDKKAKLKKLKSLGINSKNLNASDIDKILIDEWVEE